MFFFFLVRCFFWVVFFFLVRCFCLVVFGLGLIFVLFCFVFAFVLDFVCFGSFWVGMFWHFGGFCV